MASRDNGLDPNEPSYGDLKRQLQTLQAKLHQTSSPPEVDVDGPANNLGTTEPCEDLLYLRLRNHVRQSTVNSPADVILPSRKSALAILKHSATWSWLHFAGNVDSLIWDVEKLPLELDPESCESTQGPVWMSLYFTYLTVSLCFRLSRLSCLVLGRASDLLALLHTFRSSAYCS